MKKYNMYRRTLANGAWIFLGTVEATGTAKAIRQTEQKHGGYIKAELV